MVFWDWEEVFRDTVTGLYSYSIDFIVQTLISEDQFKFDMTYLNEQPQKHDSTQDSLSNILMQSLSLSNSCVAHSLSLRPDAIFSHMHYAHLALSLSLSR